MFMKYWVVKMDAKQTNIEVIPDAYFLELHRFGTGENNFLSSPAVVLSYIDVLKSVTI